jgi:hypothetical protein
LTKELGLLVINRRGREPDVEGAVGKLREFDGVELDGFPGTLRVSHKLASLTVGATWATFTSPALRGLLGTLASLVIFRHLAANDFAVERERLEHDVEALAVLVGEGKTDVEPKIVLAFASDH